MRRSPSVWATLTDPFPLSTLSLNTMATDQIITAGEKRYGCKHSGIHISPNGTVWLQFGPFSVREQWLIEQTTPKA